MSGSGLIAVFEDNKFSNFLPLTYTMPVFMLKHGFLSNLERILMGYKNIDVALLTRDYLAKITKNETGYPTNEIVKTNSSEMILFLNGRLTEIDGVQIDGEEEASFNGDDLIYLRIKKGKINNLNDKLNKFFLKDNLKEEIKNLDIKIVDSKIDTVNYPWDLILGNGNRIEKDYERFIKRGVINGEIDKNCSLYHKENIFLGVNSRVMSGTIIVADEGPVIIDENAVIMPNSIIYGPCYIGKNSLIKSQAIIYEGTTIGEVCKVGGEVEESIIHSFSNKQHHGFLGHSYVGRWCNLGAGTSNSDLKNNYSDVKIQVKNQKINTNSIFMGMIMGDHSKTAINTSINTGTVIGVMCNIFTKKFPDKYIPSFSWVGDEGIEEHNFEKAIQTAKRVMARRKKELKDEDIEMLKYIFSETMIERQR